MKYKVTLNGKTYEVIVEKGKAILLDEYDEKNELLSSYHSGTAVSVVAPIPGNIIKINVNQCDIVKKGQILIILEAMKMENEIVAPKAGTIAKIITSKGAVVDTGDPLIIIE